MFMMEQFNFILPKFFDWKQDEIEQEVRKSEALFYLDRKSSHKKNKIVPISETKYQLDI